MIIELGRFRPDVTYWHFQQCGMSASRGLSICIVVDHDAVCSPQTTAWGETSIMEPMAERKTGHRSRMLKGVLKVFRPAEIFDERRDVLSSTI